MDNRRLVRHFLLQYVEHDFSPDADRHQVLAVSAAAVVTVPLFVTMFMGMKYLMRPLQTAGWTEASLISDEMTFSALSMLVAAIVAIIEWDALGLSAVDAAILGVLPVPHRAVVTAKLLSLAVFATAFVVALNAIPSVLHPTIAVSQLPLALWKLPLLLVARAVTTVMAGVFGFSAVIVIRETLYRVIGRQRFERASDAARTVLLFVALMLLILVPARMAGRAVRVLQGSVAIVRTTPVDWFAGADAAIAGRVLDPLERRRDLPVGMAREDAALTAAYRRQLPTLTAAGAVGCVALVLTVALAACLSWLNAAGLHQAVNAGPARRGRAGAPRRIARLHVLGPARRAGVVFLARTVRRQPVHRTFLTIGLAAGVTALVVLRPPQTLPGAYVRTAALAAQTLFIAFLVAAIRSSARTAADHRAAWIFGIAETGSAPRFRAGVRAGALSTAIAAVLLLWPIDAAEWGAPAATFHAVNGAAIGWLLVEAALAGVPAPLVESIPPPDGVNTVGMVLLGAAVIATFAVAHIEQSALLSSWGRIFFPAPFLALALYVRLSQQPTV